MTPAMGPKLHHESLYPRWGFLDKFAVNEYMAKALLVTVVLLAAGQAGVAAWLALRPEMVHLRVDPDPPIRDVVIVESYTHPPRPIMEKPEPKPFVRVKSRRGGGIVIVEDLVEQGDWDAQGVAGGTGTETEYTPEGLGDVTDITGVASDPEIWFVAERDPEMISIRQPEYPEIAREAGIEGKVIVRVLVGADGFVRAAEILESVLGLDEAALAAARTAVFKPAEQQGRAVATWMVIPIEFALHDR